MTFIGWFIFFVVILAGVLLGLRVAPVYIEHYSVVHAMQSLEGDPALSPEALITGAQTTIATLLQRRLSVNNVTHVSSEDIKITQVAGGSLVRVMYEVRIPLIANIDLMFHFDDSVQVNK